MNIRGWILWIGLSLASNSSAPAQGTFQNLDFEHPTFVPYSGGFASSSAEFGPAMPGWTGYIGTTQTPWILTNDLFLSTAGIAIWGPDKPTSGYMHGSYYVVLQTGSNPFGVQGEIVSSSIAQTGMIPKTALSVQYLTRNSSPTINVLISGQFVASVLLGTANGNYLWGADISPYAGQNGELRFYGNGYLDHIQFSTQIPEPSAVALFLLGSAFWFVWMRRRRWT